MSTSQSGRTCACGRRLLQGHERGRGGRGRPTCVCFTVLCRFLRAPVPVGVPPPLHPPLELPPTPTSAARVARHTAALIALAWKGQLRWARSMCPSRISPSHTAGAGSNAPRARPLSRSAGGTFVSYGAISGSLRVRALTASGPTSPGQVALPCVGIPKKSCHQHDHRRQYG
jgi:hypothetical protein